MDIMNPMTLLGTALGGLIIWTAILHMVISSATNSSKTTKQNEEIIALLKQLVNQKLN